MMEAGSSRQIIWRLAAPTLHHCPVLGHIKKNKKTRTHLSNTPPLESHPSITQQKSSIKTE
jgi:hypothetical protein